MLFAQHVVELEKGVELEAKYPLLPRWRKKYDWSKIRLLYSDHVK